MDKSFRVKGKQKKLEERRCWINDLPDPMLSHILSFLSTKNSVRSSVLSKRWRRIWLQVPVLKLSSTLFHGDSDFVEFMDRFLKSDEKLDFKRFKLYCCFREFLSSYSDSLFQSWIDDVVGRGVRHLDVDVMSELSMPLSLYSCKTLVSLSLYNVTLAYLKPGSVVSLPCLKTMHIEFVKIDGSFILHMLIPSCPVLVKLTIITNPTELSDLTCVRSQSLKLLTFGIILSEDGVINDHAVEIDAPRLEHMSLSDHVSKSFTIRRISPSAVVDVDVNFGMEWRYLLDLDDDDDDADDSSERAMVRNFLTGVSEVSSMKISYATLKVINDYSKLEELPKFGNLTWLRASFHESSLELLPTFLGCCPSLHSLVLECDSYIEITPSQVSYVPLCFVSSLKFVKIRLPVTTRTASRMTLATYFLKNCAVMTELVLKEGFGNIIKEIRKIPRKSRGCKIVMK
ncbi:unnamed protein product [Microthlaspi erraticum]|uniref:F-box domain-containing protein n=1 Tax=Microthlaspi erraticum TaxID=1685480 RepID=A0A6D2I4I2_9BRAS|nr:unnamed protein product [Microthlaspi erraticum]